MAIIGKKRSGRNAHTGRERHMTTRRLFLSSLLALPAAGLLGAAGARAEQGPGCTRSVLTEDGLHNQPWFIQNSFLDLMEEAEAAKAAGKRFVIVIEQKGCPYCKKMHDVNLMQPAVCNFIRRHFAVLQINLKGSREVTDFDGETLPEREWRLKYKAYYTPIILFFDDDPARLKSAPPQKRVVARMDGPKAPDEFLEFFRYVWDRGYEKGSFIQYLKNRSKSG
ncbi:MAG TPA: thioredoxin [Thermopetrobacter sp.]|nr:thioredoxin [Thermopetrobacter sp.]